MAGLDDVRPRRRRRCRTALGRRLLSCALGALPQGRPGRLHTAFSFEAVADEAVFLLGPIIVTMLATAVHPVAGLSAALTFGLVGTYVFAGLRSTEPPVHPRPAAGTQRPPMPWLAIGALAVLTFALGVLFGAAEVSTVAFSEEEGQQGAAGFLLALWALGSLVAGLISGAISWRQGPLVRLRWGALGMAAAMAPLALVPSIPLMGLVLLVGGFAISPTLIAAMSLAEQVLPPARLTEGMMLLQTGIALGLAPGAALAGVVIEASGASAAYLVSFGGGVLALVAALATRMPAPSPTRKSTDRHAGGGTGSRPFPGVVSAAPEYIHPGARRARQRVRKDGAWRTSISQESAPTAGASSWLVGRARSSPSRSPLLCVPRSAVRPPASASWRSR